MAFQLSEAGTVDQELAREISSCWQAAAERNGIEMAGFALEATLEERITWALGLGLEIGCVYSRFSSKRQHSTWDQVRTCIEHAASKGIYGPPEFVCVDEGTSGSRSRREGLDRLLRLLKSGRVSVLLVFKASRLYRQAFKGYQLIQQEVVEEGLRAISVTQGIDTADTRAWRMLFQVHGMVDEMLLEATADHVRAGLKGLFGRGYTVGAIPVGYRREELPNAPLTNRGLARTVPAVDSDVKQMIVEHYQLVRDGMPIKQAWRKWVTDGGPSDPRSTSGYMTYPAYRRMLSRIAYTGRWEFGRKRNEFSTKRDYAKQVEQPDRDVEKFHCEELRIVDDELFFAVQRRLAGLKTGPRGPRKDRETQLWDLMTDLFHCASCNERFYQAGAGGNGMRCKKGDLCPCLSVVRRDEAVRAICEKLRDLVQQDAELIEQVICRAQELDLLGDEQLHFEVTALERRISSLSNQINDLHELAGQGDEADRRETMNRVRAAQAERSTARHELSRLQQRLSAADSVITPDEVRAILAEFSQLLENSTAGRLGADAVYKAVAVFRALVGERVDVHVEQRPNRKRCNVRGVFRPALLTAVCDTLGTTPPESPAVADKISVWLRKPPRLDALADRVHQLVDIEGLSYRDVAKKLQEEGHNVNSGNVWYSYRRWFEMRDEPVPDVPYNNGHQRRSA
ncbi:recombinase [bacterium]|nr:recombinase [bacterium]